MAYFSNGTEGAFLDGQCAECVFGDKPCPIIMAQMSYNYEAVGNAVATGILNILITNKEGCQLYKIIGGMDPAELAKGGVNNEREVDRLYSNLLRLDKAGKLQKGVLL
jgi:hypothetical protein